MKSKVVLSFDDGRADNYKIAMGMLAGKKIPATFNIATAYVDRSVTQGHAPCLNEPMDIGQVQELGRAGFEVAGHGDWHDNSMADIKKGIGKLRLWLGSREGQAIGFASPHSGMHEGGILANKKALEKMGVKYVRIGIKNPHGPVHRIIRKAAQVTGSVRLYQMGFGNSLEKCHGRFIIHSIPVLHTASLNQVKGIVRLAVRKNKDCTLMFHSIVKKGGSYYGDTWSWDYEDFVSLCRWLVHLRDVGIVELVTGMEAFTG